VTVAFPEKFSCLPVIMKKAAKAAAAAPKKAMKAKKA
jgi:hypothetical protein